MSTNSLGDLIDRLCITNIKLWHVQERVYDYQKMTLEQYAEVDPEETKKTWDQLAQLNLDRNRLMRETEQCFADALRTGEARVDARVKLT